MKILGFEISKEDMMKIFAGLVVAFFIFETFAINAQISQGTAGTGANNAGTGDDLDNFLGTATGTATIVSWDPGLVVLGDNRTDAEITKLKKDGLVAYSSQTTEGTMLTLSSRSSLAEAVRRLLATNASLSGFASVSLNNVRVQGDSIARNVSSSTFRFRLPPVFEQGDIMNVTFAAQVTQGKLSGVGSLQFAPEQSISTLTQPIALKVKDEYLVGEVPWEMRNSVNASSLASALGDGYNVTYRKRSSITFNPLPTQAQEGNLSAALPGYALAYQSGTLSISGLFNDSVRVKTDMASFGLTPVFGASVVEIHTANAMGNATAEFAQKAIMEKFGINTTLIHAYSVEATLGSEILYDGKNYTLPQNIVVVQTAEAPLNTSLVAIQFTPFGKVITGIERAQIIPLDSLQPLLANESMVVADTVNQNASAAAPEGANTDAPAAEAIANASR